MQETDRLLQEDPATLEEALVVIEGLRQKLRGRRTKPVQDIYVPFFIRVLVICSFLDFAARVAEWR